MTSVPADHSLFDPNIPIAWSSLEASRVEALISDAIALAEARLRQIGSQCLQSIRYENSAEALSKATVELDRIWSLVGHWNHVMDSPAFREVYNRVLPTVSDFYSGILLRPELWKVVSAFRDTPAYSELDPLRRRHVDELVMDFKECGAELDDPRRARLQAIDNRLSLLAQQYSERVLDSTNAWELLVEDSSVVSRIPEVLRDVACEQAKAKGHGTADKPVWRFTLQAPSLMPFLKYAEDPELRRSAWEASCGIGLKEPWNNSKILLEMLELRQEKAALLGCEDFASLTLKRRMVKNVGNAKDFILKLRDAMADGLQAEVRELEEFRAQILGLDAPEALEPWDIAYWSERLLNERYAFDDEWLRPYFPVDRVMAGMFHMAEQVFGLSFVEIPSRVGAVEAGASVIEVWDAQVKFYEVRDCDSSELLGVFFADWFPRESKRSGAWMDTLQHADFDREGRLVQLPIGVICGNMTPGSGGRPALLTHGEVETVFHEFGHLIHELCGRVPVSYLNGISVPWDFVELPSQIMENWCWQRESLRLFSGHVQDGRSIPDDLYEKMLATRNFQKALATMRQLSFSMMDLTLHADYAPALPANADQLDGSIDRAVEGFRPKWKRPVPSIVRRFGHLFGSSVGYAAGYYSYQWSEVLEADAFGSFMEEGLLNPDTGRRFRKEILSVGNSRDVMESYVAFRGRLPTMEAYLLRAGMPTNKAAKEPFGGK
jgi:oligopeptidase A